MHLAHELQVLATSEEKHAKHVREHLGKRGDKIVRTCLALASDARASAAELERSPREATAAG